MPENRLGQQRSESGGPVGGQNAVEDRTYQEGQRALGGARDGHQDHGRGQVHPVPPGVSEKSHQFLHAGTRRRASASST